jgi:hypothetical protein
MANDEQYYSKYLKYKAKYLQLVEQQGGLITLKSGMYAYLLTEYDAKEVCTEVLNKVANIRNIHTSLNNKGYYVKNGDTKVYKIKSTIQQAKEKASDFSANVKATTFETSKVVSSRVGLASKALSGKLQAENVTESQKKLEEAKIKAQGMRPVYDVRKQELESIRLGTTPDVISLNEKANVFDDNSLKNILTNLNKVNINLTTVVILDISPMGYNKCLKIQKLV